MTVEALWRVLKHDVLDRGRRLQLRTLFSIIARDFVPRSVSTAYFDTISARDPLLTNCTTNWSISAKNFWMDSLFKIGGFESRNGGLIPKSS